MMKTNFFQFIAHLKNTGSWTIHVGPSSQPDKMVVSVLLSDTKATKEGITLTPMIFHETPKVLDETIFLRLTEPVKQANDLWVNVAQYQQGVENAKKQLELKAKGGKSDVPKPKPEDAALKKQQYEEAMKKIADLNAGCKYAEALELLPDPAKYPDKKDELEKLRQELETKKKQLTLL